MYCESEGSLYEKVGFCSGLKTICCAGRFLRTTSHEPRITNHESGQDIEKKTMRDFVKLFVRTSRAIVRVSAPASSWAGIFTQGCVRRWNSFDNTGIGGASWFCTRPAVTPQRHRAQDSTFNAFYHFSPPSQVTRKTLIQKARDLLPTCAYLRLRSLRQLHPHSNSNYLDANALF